LHNDNDLVRLHIVDGIASISLNRPDKRNALNDAMLERLLAQLARAVSDDSVRVLLLQGEGPSFCAGVDLGEKLTRQDSSGAVEFDLLLEAFQRLEHYPRPTVAVVHGTSLAGGWELALHCNVRIAAPDAKFGMPLARLGLVAPYAAVRRLVQIGGSAAATDLLLSASLITGRRAYELGFVTHLADENDLLAFAHDYAARIAALAPLAVAEMKRVLAHVMAAPDSSDVARFDEARRRITGSADTAEGLRAFLERRPPAFTGR
jgi:enoyl-CoA hydratase/carnithine racemase